MKKRSMKIGKIRKEMQQLLKREKLFQFININLMKRRIFSNFYKTDEFSTQKYINSWK